MKALLAKLAALTGDIDELINEGVRMDHAEGEQFGALADRLHLISETAWRFNVRPK
jgi:hypothetical protein